MNYLKSLKWEMVIYALLCILMGILMMIYPSSILNTICYIIAVIFLLLAIRYLLEYRKRDLINDFYKYELVVGIIFIIAAIFVLVKKDFVISIIPFIVGIIIVISGIMKIENALDLKRMDSHWVFLLIVAIVNVLLGIVILINPQNTAVFVTRITGIILTYSGVVDLITTLTVSGKISRWVDDNAIIDTESRDIDE